MKSPFLARLVAHETRESITLTNGVVIEVHTASFRATRGFTVLAAIIDEAAFLPTDESAEPDTELLAALRPAMATVADPLLLVISTVYARRGECWRAFQKYYGRDEADVVVWKASSRQMNPCLPQKVVDQAIEADPAAAAAEYLSEWRQDVEGFIADEALSAATVTGRLELVPASGVSYVAFVDPAGGSGGDSMTLAIAHHDASRAVLDCVREFRPPFSPQMVVADFAATLNSYRVDSLVGDRFAGEWAREPFRNVGLTYELATDSKSEIYKAILPAINSGEVELLDLPRLRGQLRNLERRTARGGRDTIDHAQGGHDDVANAAAGALLMAIRSRQQMSSEMFRMCLEASSEDVNPSWNPMSWEF